MRVRTAAAAAPYTPGTHVPILDGLRGLAILLVILRHTSHYMGAETTVGNVVEDVLGSGWVGVDLFFVLSGFLITGILVDAKGSEHYFRNFYVRRSLRIFPLYYGFLVAIFFVLPWLLGKRGGDVGRLLDNQEWYWTYLVNVLVSVEGTVATPLNTTHLWSLAVEEQFYLVWPALVLWTSRERLVQLCVFMIAAALAMRIVIAGLAGGDGHVAGYMLTPARMDALAFGALVALTVRTRGGCQWLARWAGPAAAVCGALLVVLVVTREGLSWSDVATQTVGFTVIACLSTAVLALALVAPTDSWLHRALDRRWLRALGTYSYAIYLFHYPLLYLVPLREVPALWGTKIPAQAAFTAAVTLASFVLAWLSWHLYEKHFLKLKRYFPTGRGPTGRGAAEGEAGESCALPPGARPEPVAP